VTLEEAAAVARAEQTRQRLLRVDTLAELVAEGHTMRKAAAIMGIGENTAYSYWAEIKRGLGWLG